MVERTVTDFVSQVGMKNLMGEVNVTERMVRHAARKGVMPAKWYVKATDLAKQKSVAPPATKLFSFS